MTREDIINFKPGKELDHLIAEKVMGWTKEVFMSGTFRWYASEGGVYTHSPKGEEWNPSTNIYAAWEVVEHFTDKEVTIKRYEGMDSKFRYVCWIVDDFIDLQVIALTAPEAICKAALLAALNL